MDKTWMKDGSPVLSLGPGPSLLAAAALWLRDRTCHWHRGRRWGPGQRPAAAALRGDDPHLDLRRGAASAGRKPQENQSKTVGKPSENHQKTIGNPLGNGDSMGFS